MKCPAGHEAGTEFEGRRCSELVCAEQAPAFLAPKPKAPAKPPPKPRLKDASEEAKPALAAWLARQKEAGVPDELTPTEALEWSQKRLAELLPEAVAELQYQLRFGTDRQKSEAVDRIFRANGVAQKDAASGTTPTIIVNLGSSMDSLPFLKRAEEARRK